MNKLILILALVSHFALSANSQKGTFTTDNVVDKSVHFAVNEYRAHFQLKPLAYLPEIYAMAKHHTEYQVSAKDVSHYEKKNVDGLRKFNSLDERFEYYLTRSQARSCSENILGGHYVIVLRDTTPFAMFISEIYNLELTKLTDKQIISYFCVWQWAISEKHNKILLTPKCTMSAVSITYSQPKRFDEGIFFEGQPILEFDAYGTMNLAK